MTLEQVEHRAAEIYTRQPVTYREAETLAIRELRAKIAKDNLRDAATLAQAAHTRATKILGGAR